MKKALISVLFLCMASLAAIGETTVVGDNFNDNARNKATWKVADVTAARLVETNKRLYFDDLGSTNSLHIASWAWKLGFLLGDGGVFQVSFLVNMPDVVTDGAIGHYSAGVTLTDGFPLYKHTAYIYAMKSQAGRLMGLSSPFVGKTWALPVNVSRFYVICRYNKDTGMLTIWQKAVDGSWKKKAGSFSLDELWKIQPDLPTLLSPQLTIQSSTVFISPADKVYIDNATFTVIQD